MELTFSKMLMEQMFHLDFKYHIKALDTLTKVCLLNVSVLGQQHPKHTSDLV